MQTSVLTLHHVPVLRQVQSALRQETQEGEPELSVKTLAAWDEEKWFEIVEKSSANGDSLPAATAEPKSYVAAILENLDAYLPSERLFAQANLTARQLPIKADSPLVKLYSHLGLKSIADNGQLDPDEQRKQVNQQLQRFENFRQNNPAMDLRHVDLVKQKMFVDGEPVDLKWDNIPDDQRTNILNRREPFNVCYRLLRTPRHGLIFCPPGIPGSTFKSSN